MTDLRCGSSSRLSPRSSNSSASSCVYVMKTMGAESSMRVAKTYKLALGTFHDGEVKRSLVADDELGELRLDRGAPRLGALASA